METKTKEMVDAVKAHAQSHYSDGGWDVVVECYTDKEIAEHIGRYNATTPKQAIAAFKSCVSVWADRQADAAYHRRQAGGDL